MTYQEMLAEIPHLSVHERLALLEALTRSLREELEPPMRTGSLAKWLRGIAKTDVPPLTDEEIKEDYINYLAEKYL